MDSDKYEGRVLTIEDAREGTNRFANKQKQTIFQNKKGNMIVVTIEKMISDIFYLMVFLPYHTNIKILYLLKTFKMKQN